MNTILAEKGIFRKNKNIQFNSFVDESDLSFIKPPDLYALLGNAIDYVETQEKDLRVISLRITRKDNFIGIQVTNPYAGEEVKGDLTTHKANPLEHALA